MDEVPATSGDKVREVLGVDSSKDWETWLGEHHATSNGVWLKIAKKGSRLNGPSYDAALDAALRFGWIDGQKRSLDDDFWLQRFTPRRPKSRWSRINVEKAKHLLKQGLMTPSGLAQIEAARADGRWDSAYESQGNTSVPDDFQRALDANPLARDFFESLDARNRYSILYRIQDAKKPETRARRIETYTEMLNEGRRIHE